LIFTRSKNIHVGGVPFGAELAPIFKGEGQIIRMDPLGWNTGIQGLLSVIAHRPPKGLMDGPGRGLTSKSPVAVTLARWLGLDGEQSRRLWRAHSGYPGN